MARPVAMGWHGVAIAIPGQQDDSFLPSLGIFSQVSLQLYICI